jgi:serine/threonine protein kinase
VIHSINLSDSVDKKEIENEIEKQVNLCHPCIAPVMGFVFRTESSEFEELNIVRLFMEGSSLREVVLVNPVWWTPTVKAKAVVGIALGLQFAHSFGMIHGNLNSNTILFNECHRIEMTDFGLIDLEKQGSESGTGSEVFGEGWTAQVDIAAFRSLLIEIIADEEVPDFVSKMIEAIGSRDYKTINSMKNIVDLLKKKDFKIETGVDSAEVWEFVKWVENSEE